MKDDLTLKGALVHKTTWEVLKYERDIEEYRLPDGRLDYDRFFAENEPYEIVKGEGNILLSGGINLLWRLFTGESGLTPFNSANSYIGVGDGTAAASATQNSLQGTNQYFKVVDSGFPQVSGTQCIWQATFGGAEANFAWNEAGVANGNNPPTTGTLFNRIVQSLGTKASGQTWTLKITITLS